MGWRDRFDQGAIRRLGNLGMLIGGFGLGQGSIFLAQSYLVARGNTALLAQFGTHFSFAMLAIITVEAGSLTVMARQIAHSLYRQYDPRDAWACFWHTSVFRLTMATLLSVLAIGVSSLFDLGAFSRNYMLFALPALFIWAFNAAGFLDGLQKSGVSGLTGSIAYVASAIALLLSLGMEPAEAGRLAGSALTLGYALTVIVQFTALAISGWKPQFVRPTAQGVRQAFTEEGSMLAGLLPGQLYFRAQLALSGLFLGTDATAILVYGKQVIGAASQVSGFARRIEFPRLVQATAEEPRIAPREILTIQKTSFAIASVMAFGIAAIGLGVTTLGDGFAARAWLFLGFFAITILTEAVGQALVQGLFARNRYHGAALARISAVCLALVFAYLTIGTVGMATFIVADILSHMTVILVSLRLLKKPGHVGEPS